MKRLERLTQEHLDAMQPHVEKWVKIALSTEPADWDEFEAGARGCYEFIGVPWPDCVIRVSSPFVIAVAAPIAALLIDRADKTKPEKEILFDKITQRSMSAVLDGIRDMDDEITGILHENIFGGVSRRIREGLGNRIRGILAHDARPMIFGRDDILLTQFSDLSSPIIKGVFEQIKGAVNQAAGDRMDISPLVHLHHVEREVRRSMSIMEISIGQVLSELTSSDWYRKYWHANHLGGQWGLSWQAFTSFIRDVIGLELPGDLWERERAFARAQMSTGWWWPHRKFVMVSDRPSSLHIESFGEPGFSRNQFHCDDGPAIAWRDGWALYFLHGVRVPPDLVEGKPWTLEQIMRERNSEVRRVAIEKVGWERLESQLGAPVAISADPGNPGRRLALYDLPEAVYGAPRRVVLMTNGSPDRSGRLRRYGEPVPAEISDPISAQAWAYGVPREEYAALQRRT